METVPYHLQQQLSSQNVFFLFIRLIYIWIKEFLLFKRVGIFSSLLICSSDRESRPFVNDVKFLRLIQLLSSQDSWNDRSLQAKPVFGTSTSDEHLSINNLLPHLTNFSTCGSTGKYNSIPFFFLRLFEIFILISTEFSRIYFFFKN